MKRIIGQLFLRVSGWKIHPELPPEIHRSIVVLAPHTSNWDFIVGSMGFWGQYQVDIKFLMKKSMLIPPISWLLNWMGAIGVDRKNKTNLTQSIVNMYKKHEKLTIIIAPEGTRSHNPIWKKGFYYIAKEANIPIILGFLDYPSKTGGIFKVFYPTDDIDADIRYIQSLYSKYTGKNPYKGQ